MKEGAFRSVTTRSNLFWTFNNMNFTGRRISYPTKVLISNHRGKSKESFHTTCRSFYVSHAEPKHEVNNWKQLKCIFYFSIIITPIGVMMIMQF